MLNFKKQPWLSGWCGAYAIYNCFAAAGTELDIASVINLTSKYGKTISFFTGVDHEAIKYALKNLGCSHYDVDLEHSTAAKRLVDAALNAHIPIITCVADGGHWITVVGRDPSKDLYMVIDSSNFGTLVSWITWDEYVEWNDQDNFYYILVNTPDIETPLIPWTLPKIRKSMGLV